MKHVNYLNPQTFNRNFVEERGRKGVDVSPLPSFQLPEMSVLQHLRAWVGLPKITSAFRIKLLLHTT